MGDWALQGGQRYEAAGVDAASTVAALLTAAGSAHVKGSYTQLIASTAFDASGLFVHVTAKDSGRFLIDFAIGAAAAEQVIVPNILSQGPAGQFTQNALFTVPIPAGARLAARTQSSVVSAQIRAMVHPLAAGFTGAAPLGRVTDYGTLTGTTAGTIVDPGGVAHTKGSYAQITASTTNPIRQLILAFGYQGEVTGSDVRWFLDIAVGAGGSEQIVIPDLFLTVNNTLDEFTTRLLGPFAIEIPAGTRLAARAQSSDITAATRDFDLALYGID